MSDRNGTVILRLPQADPSDTNWLAQAEAIGKVELESWFGARRASITIGEWGDKQLRVWADGNTSGEALERAVKKVRALVREAGDGN